MAATLPKLLNSNFKRRLVKKETLHFPLASRFSRTDYSFNRFHMVSILLISLHIG